MAITLVAVCIDSLDVLEVGLALDALHAGLPALPPGLLDDPSRRERINRSLADADWREDACALLEDPAMIEAAQAFVDGCPRVVGSRGPDSMLDPSWLEAVQEAYSRSEGLGELGEALLVLIDPDDDEELGEEPADTCDRADEDEGVEELRDEEELRPVAKAAPGDVTIAAQVIVALTDVTYVERYGLTVGGLELDRRFETDPAVLDAARVFLRACAAVAPTSGPLSEALHDPTWWQFLRWGFETGSALRALANTFLQAAAKVYGATVPCTVAPEVGTAPERVELNVPRTARRVPLAATPWRSLRARGARGSLSAREPPIPSHCLPARNGDPARARVDGRARGRMQALRLVDPTTPATRGLLALTRPVRRSSGVGAPRGPPPLRDGVTDPCACRRR
ncbi:hypothetical protein [Polyangium sp. y55x31]|uniref:hypothetical protein n=1 Tax=Polyangium sp. y55x31 TaxID=3042688 RepID=UPI002482CD9F|nr:hypothetical protein [Polyangium sp. y55x31]MDI1484713.1 hypothetical protein [Polyangium sp. y55x31]